MTDKIKCSNCGGIVPRVCANCWRCSSCCDCSEKGEKWTNGKIRYKVKKELKRSNNKK